MYSLIFKSILTSNSSSTKIQIKPVCPTTVTGSKYRLNHPFHCFKMIKSHSQHTGGGCKEFSIEFNRIICFRPTSKWLLPKEFSICPFCLPASFFLNWYRVSMAGFWFCWNPYVLLKRLLNFYLFVRCHVNDIFNLLNQPCHVWRVIIWLQNTGSTQMFIYS